MIEQAIYFALGCIVTALLALLFAPVFWSRALRLTRKRLQLQVPMSMQEILAERDQLRAAYAVERLRIEQDIARVRATKDADMVAIGRQTVEAARLAEELDAVRRLKEAQGHEIALLTSAVADHKVEGSELRRNLAAAHAKVEDLRLQAEAAAREHARVAAEGEGHRASAASLVARVADLDTAQARVAALEKELAAGRAEREGGLGAAGDAEVTARLERLEAENAALKRTVEVFEREAEAGNAGPSEAGLRESIHALGLAVATMTRERGRERRGSDRG